MAFDFTDANDGKDGQKQILASWIGTLSSEQRAPIIAKLQEAEKVFGQKEVDRFDAGLAANDLYGAVTSLKPPQNVMDAMGAMKSAVTGQATAIKPDTKQFIPAFKFLETEAQKPYVPPTEISPAPQNSAPIPNPVTPPQNTPRVQTSTPPATPAPVAAAPAATPGLDFLKSPAAQQLEKSIFTQISPGQSQELRGKIDALSQELNFQNSEKLYTPPNFLERGAGKLTNTKVYVPLTPDGQKKLDAINAKTADLQKTLDSISADPAISASTKQNIATLGSNISKASDQLYHDRQNYNPGMVRDVFAATANTAPAPDATAKPVPAPQPTPAKTFAEAIANRSLADTEALLKAGNKPTEQDLQAAHEATTAALGFPATDKLQVYSKSQNVLAAIEDSITEQRKAQAAPAPAEHPLAPAPEEELDNTKSLVESSKTTKAAPEPVTSPPVENKAPARPASSLRPSRNKSDGKSESKPVNEPEIRRAEEVHKSPAFAKVSEALKRTGATIKHTFDGTLGEHGDHEHETSKAAAKPGKQSSPASKKVPKELYDDMRDADKDHDGVVSRKELKKAIKDNPDLAKDLKKHGLSEDKNTVLKPPVAPNVRNAEAKRNFEAVTGR